MMLQVRDMDPGEAGHRRVRPGVSPRQCWKKETADIPLAPRVL